MTKPFATTSMRFNTFVLALSDSSVRIPVKSIRVPDRAARLREQVKAGPDNNFARVATSDPYGLATTAAWQSSHYADAIGNAQQAAAKGNANAEALLGKRIMRAWACQEITPPPVVWLYKSVAQGNVKAMFILGLM